jgi:hypothetical protein
LAGRCEGAGLSSSGRGLDSNRGLRVESPNLVNALRSPTFQSEDTIGGFGIIVLLAADLLAGALNAVFASDLFILGARSDWHATCHRQRKQCHSASSVLGAWSFRNKAHPAARISGRSWS